MKRSSSQEAPPKEAASGHAPAPRPGPRARARARTFRASVVALVVVAAAPVLLAACGGSDGSSADGPKLTGEAAKGQQLFRSSGCAACHSVSGEDGVGPALNGLAGGKVELEDGTTVTADDAYLREAITRPDAETVKGFRPVMPRREFAPDEVDALVAYLQAIGSTKG